MGTIPKNAPSMRDQDCIELLRELIRIPSPSGGEQAVCALVSSWLERQGIVHSTPRGNLVALAAPPDPDRRTLALLAHMDTVPPAAGYTRNPYDPGNEPDVVYGLGSNDDGGSIAAMLATFRHFYGRELPVNLMLILSREEECSGPDGTVWLFGPDGPFRSAADDPARLPMPDWAIVGEPTGMRAATSERGLLVLDGEAVGVSGHAARSEGVNALYIALDDIARLRRHRFERISPEMGPVRMTVTQIEAGTAHNTVPDRCRFVVDIRPTEQYACTEILTALQALCQSTLTPRNLRNRSSATAPDSPLRRAVAALDFDTFSSPTTSDWMQLPCDAVKMGPGESSRSHRADEYIRTAEIETAIIRYTALIEYLYGNTLE